jgi:hypothetical protein
MNNTILAIGYSANDQDKERTYWKNYDIELDFASDISSAVQKLRHINYIGISICSGELSHAFLELLRSSQAIPWKFVIFDISENGRQADERFFIQLNAGQKEVWLQSVLEGQTNSVISTHSPGFSQMPSSGKDAVQPLTEIKEGALYFCQEHRLVSVHGQIIELTAKEFDILALLISHPRRVFTYEMIMDLVWKEDYTYYSRKAINNHVSNLRKKLKVAPDVPDYIKSVHSVGYKFMP